jgi:hypothetical protein
MSRYIVAINVAWENNMGNKCTSTFFFLLILLRSLIFTIMSDMILNLRNSQALETINLLNSYNGQKICIITT